MASAPAAGPSARAPDRDGFSPVVTVPISPSPAPSTPATSSSALSSSSPAPTPSASAPVQSAPVSPSAVASARPTALTLVTLPVVECPTQYGIDNPGSPVAVKSVTVSGDVASNLANYTDGLHYMSVVGPRGWHCDAIDAADGNADLFIAPPGASSAPSGNSYTKDAREGIGARFGVSAQLPFEFTCAAMPDLGVTSDAEKCPKVPAGERFTRVNHTTADFIDPPGVAGIGTPSGGPYTARGQIRYSPPPTATTGDEAAQVTCTLPASDASLCQTIVDWLPTMGRPDRRPGRDPAVLQLVASQNRRLAPSSQASTRPWARQTAIWILCRAPRVSPPRSSTTRSTPARRPNRAVRLRRQLRRAEFCSDACVHHRRRRRDAVLSRRLRRSDVDAHAARALARERTPADRRPAWA